MVVAPHHRLAAGLGPLAHSFARLDGLVLEVDGADGRVHGAQEEEQVGAAAGTLMEEAETRPSAQRLAGRRGIAVSPTLMALT